MGGLLGFGPEGTWPDGWSGIMLILGVSLVHECVYVHFYMCVNVPVCACVCVHVYICMLVSVHAFHL